MRRFVRVALALVSLTLVGATSAQAEKRVALCHEDNRISIDCPVGSSRHCFCFGKPG
jgi:hypothetical protein